MRKFYMDDSARIVSVVENFHQFLNEDAIGGKLTNELGDNDFLLF